LARRTWESVGVALGYVAISFGYFGIRVLPDPSRELIGTGADPQIFVWSFAWWPHALGNGSNPFVTHAIWAPDGINLAWVTSIPGLAIAYAPLTLTAGAIAAYNAAAVLAPALAATTAFLLCRHVTGSFWPSVVGGYLFGFSSYMLGQSLAHMHMTPVFLVPVAALLVLQYVESSLDARGLTWRLGVLLAIQMWFSTELFFTLTLALLAGLGLAAATVHSVRPRLRTLVRPVLGAYALATVLTAPLLFYALTEVETGSINRPADFGADAVNFLVPTRLIAAGAVWAPPIAARFGGNDSETTAYLGLPVVLMIVWYAIGRWRVPGSRFLVLALVTGAVAALGTSLHVAGREITPLPWNLIARLPIFSHTLPVRFSMYVSLAAAVIVALWMRSAAKPAVVLLPALAVLALVPRLDLPLWHFEPVRPAFFTQGLYRDCLKPGESVFTVPWNAAGNSLLWQVDADFDIRLPGGYVRPGLPESFTPVKAAWEMHFDAVIPHSPDLQDFFQRKNVDRAVVELSLHDAWKGPLEYLGPPSIIGGVAVYPSCGSPRTASDG